MQHSIFTKTGFLCVATLILGSCESGAPFGQQTFRGQYSVARDALETGNYDLAARKYAKLAEAAGPLEARIRLEYAHTQLRAENYADAAQQASQLAAEQTGTARAAALAVQATAEHELGMAARTKGDHATAKQLLESADSAMAEILKSHPDLDPMGALAARRASINTQLKTL